MEKSFNILLISVIKLFFKYLKSYSQICNERYIARILYFTQKLKIDRIIDKHSSIIWSLIYLL